MATTSNYPGAIDSLPSPPATLDGPPTHEDMHLQLADAVELVETELGVNGRHRTVRSYATDAARDSANGTPSAGHVAFTEDDDALQVYNGAAWQKYPRTQWGTSSVDTLTSNRITFPVAFGSAPSVQLTAVHGSDPYLVTITSVTATYVNLVVFDDGVQLAGPAVPVHWVAFSND